MKSLARITAVIFFVLGPLILLAGVTLIVNGALTPIPQIPPQPDQLPDLTRWLVIAEMIAGGYAGLQGLFVAATGEVLWLSASIADRSEKNGQHLRAIFNRDSQAGS